MSRPRFALASLVLVFASSLPAADPAPTPPVAPAATGGTIGPALMIEPARVPTPWYFDVESAFQANTAWEVNGRLYRIERDKPTYLSSRLYLGYRFEAGDSLRLTARNLNEVGRLGYDSPGFSSDRDFTTNWFDLDYVSREYAPLDAWRVQWEFGGRFVHRYESWESLYDATYHEKYTHTYFGGGPHLGLTSHILLGCTGWSLFGRADGAATFGSGVDRTYYSHPPMLAASSVLAPATYRDSKGQVQFDLGGQAGLMKRWQTDACTVGLGFGVQLDVLSRGRLDRNYLDTFGLVLLGGFLRCEIGF